MRALVDNGFACIRSPECVERFPIAVSCRRRDQWLLAAIVLRSALGWIADATAIRAAGGVKHEIRCRVFGELVTR